MQVHRMTLVKHALAEPTGSQESAAMASCCIVAGIAQAGIPGKPLVSAIELLKQIMKLSWGSAQPSRHQPASQRMARDSLQHNGTMDAEGMISEDDEELADPALEQLNSSEATEQPSTVSSWCPCVTSSCNGQCTACYVHFWQTEMPLIVCLQRLLKSSCQIAGSAMCKVASWSVLHVVADAAAISQIRASGSMRLLDVVVET